MFNKLIVATLPLVPRPIIRKISSRYIAGDHLADAIATARQLQADEGARTTIGHVSRPRVRLRNLAAWEKSWLIAG